MRKVFCAVIGATVMAFGVATSAAEGNVSIGVPNWDYAKVISNVLKVISEERLGTQVSIVPATNPVAFRAMHRGKGDIDVHPDVWMPNQQSFTAEYVDQKKTVHLGEKHYLAEQGLCVFRSTRDTHGIRSVDDLANPEKARLFDSNGDGKGEMWIGAPNWASTSIQKVKARDYGYGGLFELKVMKEDLALSEIDAAAANGANMVFFCYSPHFMFAKHTIVRLEEPPYDASRWNMLQPADDPNWYDKSSVSVASPPVTGHIAYSKTLEQRAPEVAKLLRNVQLDTDLLSSWSYAIAVDKKYAAAYAKEWVEANPERVNQWLGM